jgi:hypothetical protein
MARELKNIVQQSYLRSTLDLEIHVHRLHIRGSDSTSASSLGSWDSSIFSVTHHKHTLVVAQPLGCL